MVHTMIMTPLKRYQIQQNSQNLCQFMQLLQPRQIPILLSLINHQLIVLAALSRALTMVEKVVIQIQPFLQFLIEQSYLYPRNTMKSRNPKLLWRQEQEQLLTALVKKYGARKWSKMADEIFENYGGAKKTGKQCRERWFNHLNPSVVKNQWTREEEDLMFEEHRKYGNKWTLLVEKLVGRSDNAIKNHFYSIIRKSLRRINKFLGSKNGTETVRKIKPAMLSKIFQFISQDSSESIQPSGQETQQTKSRQIAYHLINFSRWKLSDTKNHIPKEDIQKLEKLLQEVHKLTQENKKQEIPTKTQIKRQSISLEEEKQAPKQHLNWLELNLSTKTEPDLKKCPTLSSPLPQSQPQPQSLTPSANSVFKSLQNQSQTVSSLHPQIFNFCVQLQLQQNQPQIHQISTSSWLRITPYIITPPISNLYMRAISTAQFFGADDCDQIADNIIMNIQKNDQRWKREGVMEMQNEGEENGNAGEEVGCQEV